MKALSVYLHLLLLIMCHPYSILLGLLFRTDTTATYAFDHSLSKTVRRAVVQAMLSAKQDMEDACIEHLAEQLGASQTVGKHVGVTKLQLVQVGCRSSGLTCATGVLIMLLSCLSHAKCM